jgi:hypothetical protein
MAAEVDLKGSDPDDAGDGHPPAIAHVGKFLEQIRGFDLLSQELEKQIWGNRFDLLAPDPNRAQSKLDSDGKEKRMRLPRMEDVPKLQDLRDALLGGGLPDAHQRVAHILYPTEVPWPAELPVDSDDSKDSELESSMQESGVKSLDLPFTKEETCPSQGQREASKNLAPPDSENKRRSSSFNVVDRAAMRMSGPAQQPSLGQERTKTERGATEALLRGQPITATVRGRDLTAAHLNSDETPDLIKNLMDSKVSQERYSQAKERRLELERAVRMEKYQESKITERIMYLEAAQKAEVELKEEIAKKDKQRQRRGNELKELSQKNWQRKCEEERAAHGGDRLARVTVIGHPMREA